MFWFSFQEFLCAGGVWKFFLSPDDYQNRRLSKGSGDGRYCAVPGARKVARRRAALRGGAFPGRVRECEEVPQKRAAAAAQFRGISRARTTKRQYPSCECGCKKGAPSRAPSLRFLMPSPRAFDEAPSVITCKQVSPHPRPDSLEEPVDPGSLRFGADPRNALQRRRP